MTDPKDERRPVGELEAAVVAAGAQRASWTASDTVAATRCRTPPGCQPGACTPNSTGTRTATPSSLGSLPSSAATTRNYCE